MGSAQSSNISSQSQVAKTDIGTSVEQTTSPSSVSSNTLVQICGDITGTSAGTCDAGYALTNTCCPATPSKNNPCTTRSGKCKEGTFSSAQCVYTGENDELKGTTERPTVASGVENACNMEDVNQTISIEQVEKAFQKAQLSTVAKTSLNQAMQQMAKATVSNFNVFQFSKAVNNSTQQLSMQTKITNNIKQTCGGNSTAMNSVYKQCGDVSGTANNVCNIKGLSQTIGSKQIVDCMQKATVHNSVMQSARQKAEQTAVAKSVGVDLLGGFVMWILVAIGAVALLFVIGGAAADGAGRKLAGNGGSPRTKLILYIVAAVFVITGATVWIIMSQQNIGPGTQGIKAGYFGRGGYAQEQALGTIFPDDTKFPDFDYAAWNDYLTEVRKKCPAKDTKVDTDDTKVDTAKDTAKDTDAKVDTACFNKNATFEQYCKQFDSQSTCTGTGKLAPQICGWTSGGANPSCGVVSGMLGKIQEVIVGRGPNTSRNQCALARKKYHKDKSDPAGFDCVGWYWRRAPGFPSNIELGSAKGNTGGWFGDILTGETGETCDKTACQNSGFDPSSPACQNCCNKDKWPVITDLCGTRSRTECEKGDGVAKGAGCSLKCKWDDEEGCSGTKYACPTGGCDSYKCKQFACTDCKNTKNTPVGTGFLLKRRKDGPTASAPDGKGTGGIGKPLNNNKIKDQSPYRCLGTSERVACAYVEGAYNSGTLVAAVFLGLGVVMFLLGLSLKGDWKNEMSKFRGKFSRKGKGLKMPTKPGEVEMTTLFG